MVKIDRNCSSTRIGKPTRMIRIVISAIRIFLLFMFLKFAMKLCFFSIQ